MSNQYLSIYKKQNVWYTVSNMIYRLQDVGSINSNTKGATSEAGTPEFTVVFGRVGCY